MLLYINIIIILLYINIIIITQNYNRKLRFKDDVWNALTLLLKKKLNELNNNNK